MRPHSILIALCLMTLAVHAEPVVLDDFADPGRWEVVKTEGVELELSGVPGVEGDALRLEYDFTKGAGFCIIRREIDLPLPANYRFDLHTRGEGPANNLEFKLVSESGDDVWWVNRRAFEPPAEWTRLRNRRRHFEFAWGPSGGTPMERVGSIEFAIAASEGGKGYIELDELTFETLPDVDPRPVGGVIRHGTDTDAEPAVTGGVDEAGVIPWQGSPGAVLAVSGWVEVAFDHAVEFGAIEIEWDTHRPISPYQILASDDGAAWRTIKSVDHERGGTHAFYLPESEARVVRIVPGSGFAGHAPVRLRLVPIDEVPDTNSFWSARARAERRGLYPPYFLGERAAWTIIGLPGDNNEVLISEYGAIETQKGGCTIEPFMYTDDRLITWADAEVTRSLEGGFIPIPTVSWRAGQIGLDITGVATGEPGAGRLLVRYRVSNHGGREQVVDLKLVPRLFQVQPSYQQLNIIGGKSDAQPLRLARVDPSSESTVSALAEIGLAADSDAPFEDTSTYRLSIPPAGHADVVLAAPLHGGPGWESVGEATPGEFDSALEAERGRWDALLETPGITLPESRHHLVDTLRTAIAHILINQDGPAIQPGSRTYERSWIRDGSVTSLALIHAGHADLAREYIDWYAGYQFESGKVPCVVDYRGPDPVDEHDSTGEFIFALRNAAIATGDAGLLREHFDKVKTGVEYMESLRAQRLSDDYALSADPIKRACIGLMPESISHEGYSAKPMHSYWDDFWALRGYLDAADIARRLDKSDDARRFDKIALDFRDDLYNSIRLAADHHGLDHIPGCVELGDFDATSTSIAIFPVDELGRAPEPLLTNTFEKYWQFFVDRRDGVEAWDGMTPYELRIVGAFVRLGWADRAHELLDWLLELRSPTGWNQWGEIAYADPSQGRFVGDMPHTWVASGYVLSVLSMFAYERGDEIVLAPAIPADWVFSPGGVGVDGMWTRWGSLSYRYTGEGDGVVFRLLDAPDAPGGLVMTLPDNVRGDVLVDGQRRPIGDDSTVRLRTGESRVTFRVDR